MSTFPSEPVAYRPIGTVAGAGGEPLRPELIRSMEARLVPEPRFAPAVAALEVGAHLFVVYDLHRAEAWDARYTEESFRPILAVKPYQPLGDPGIPEAQWLAARLPLPASPPSVSG